MSTPSVFNGPIPPPDEKEILRYAASRGGEEELELLHRCLPESLSGMTYRGIWMPLEVTRRGACIDLGFISLESSTLSRALLGCSGAILFAATVGIHTDRLVVRYGSLAPSRALMHQAIGAERVEALCDALCRSVEKELSVTLRPRVSPGYGDIPMSMQGAILSTLDLPRRIGVSLTEGGLMTPTKSVTAIAGFYT